MLARRGLEIYTQLYGAESRQVANGVEILAGVLDYFNDIDDDNKSKPSPLILEYKADCL